MKISIGDRVRFRDIDNNFVNARVTYFKNNGMTHSKTSPIPVGKESEREGGARNPLPSRMRVDLETPFEKGLTFFTRASFYTALFFAVGIVKAAKIIAFPISLMLIILFALLGIAGYFFRRSADCYYLLESENRRLIYHFEWLGFVHERPYLSADMIKAVSGTATLRRMGGKVFFGYAVVVDKQGRMHPLSDTLASEGDPGGTLWEEWHVGTLDEVNRKAGLIAQVLGTKVMECPPESYLVPRRTSEGFLLNFADKQLMLRAIEDGESERVILFLVFLLAFISFMIFF